jgi:hypothetical protein
VLKAKTKQRIAHIKVINHTMVHFFEQNKATEKADNNRLFYIVWGKKPERSVADASVTRPAQ